MKFLDFCRYALGLCVSAAILVGCGGPRRFSDAGVTPAIVHPAYGGSWMAPDASGQDLLYVSNDYNKIYVFAYPAGTLVGTLSDGNAPFGECVDKAGDVFIVNFGGTIGTPGILEYTHGGTKPKATLKDPGYNPQACSIDPTTGNLAVTNTSGTNGGQGTIAIYQNAKGSPTYYVDPGIYYMDFCGYDDHGNLFVDGQHDHQGTFRFDELPKGSSTFKKITINRKIGFPLNIQWAAKYVALAYSPTVIYHIAVSGSKGSVIGTTNLNGPVAGIEVQFWIQGSTIIVPYGRRDMNDRIGFWNYPAGGRIKKRIRGSELKDTDLFGTTVSLAPHR